ncbi:hypothetical protein IID19_01995 [Patescibacteria group bacterium]|nr:hypothetical protein [Patescibacteria group bacterium]
MYKNRIYIIFALIITGVLVFSILIPAPSAIGQELPNPIGEKDGKPISLLDVILRVLQIVLAAVDIFALFMFIFGGFQLLISAGNPNMIKKAKDTLVWATLGILVITLSYSILKFIFEEVRKGF